MRLFANLLIHVLIALLMNIVTLVWTMDANGVLTLSHVLLKALLAVQLPICVV